MQRYYAARAPEYDRIYQKPERQLDLAALRLWLPPLFADTYLLEIACGTGYWTQFIAPAAAAVLAIDAAPETLRIARERVPQAHVKFVLGDAYDLPHRQNKLTAAFAGFCFSHVPITRRRAFLEGLSAVLSPGARVVLLDNQYVEGSSTPISERDADGNCYQTRKLANGSQHRVLKNFPAEQELHAAIVGIGAAATFKPFGYYWVFQYTNHANHNS